MGEQPATIKSVSDFGNDWTIVGIESGDTTHLLIPQKLQQQLVIVIARFSEQKVIYCLGSKKCLASDYGREIINTISEHYKLKRSIQPLQNNELLKKIYKEWEERVKNNKVNIQNADKKSEEISELNNVKEALSIIEQCLKDGVSDLHLEVRENDAKIKRRSNGTLTLLKPLTAHEGKTFGNTIYNVLVTVGKEIFDPKHTQDGLIDKDIGTTRLRGRVATVPVQPNGFDMVIRLLEIQNAVKPKSLDALGYASCEVKRIEIATSKASGAVIIAGTTGSGKSTTLQNLLMMQILKERGGIKVFTVEDPVEYFIPNATQVSVVRDADGDASASFSAIMRTALRSDPDILMVGEIRDSQSCDLMKAAIQSGHPVFSTIHAQTCIAVIKRLEALGLGRDVLSSQNFLSGLFYQKLLPKICPKCAKPLIGNKIPFRLSESDCINSMKILSGEVISKWHKLFLEDSSNISFTRFLQDKKVINCIQADSIGETYQIFNNKEKASELYERISKVVKNLKNETILFKGSGCKHCKGSGIIGRTPVSEGITFDMEMLAMVAANDERALISYWRKNKGGKFALEDAVIKMKQGLVDPIDVESQLDLLDSVSI